jgi:hypothetical protein
MSAATVLDQELDEIFRSIQVRAIADDATIALGLNETGALQNRQMARQSARRNIEVVGQISGWNRIRRQPDQLPEDFEARFLGKCAKCRERLLWFHISRIIDRNKTVKSAKYESCMTGVKWALRRWEGADVSR